MAAALETVARLLRLADCDTVYRDLYLTRARALLAPQLSAEQYREGRAAAQAVTAAVAESRAAAQRLDWARAEEQAQRADQLRRAADARAAAMQVGEEVYDAAPTVIDPFSPGLAELAEGEPSELRAQAVADLGALATADDVHAAFYAQRRKFLDGLVVLARSAPAAEAAAGTMSTDEMQQRALAAADRGDVAALARFARELAERQKAAASAAPQASAGPAAAPSTPLARCPVDLAAPLPAAAIERARPLGLGAVTAAPLPQSQPLFDFIATHILQARPADAEVQREGIQRIEALRAELGWPAETSAAVTALLGQFLHQLFVNSGGARYVPPIGSEAILIEDFAEDGAPAAGDPLVAALGLAARAGRSRLEIEQALHARGAAIVRDQLSLDPLEFRLVCVPPDLYTRVGRERGWGQQARWTHFDGYQVLKGGTLRALVGGDARYGGLNDLVSIAVNDQRDGVVARFAVIRRARQVARWN